MKWPQLRPESGAQPARQRPCATSNRASARTLGGSAQPQWRHRQLPHRALRATSRFAWQALMWGKEKRLSLELRAIRNPERVAPDAQAARCAVVPLQQDLELIRVPDLSAEFHAGTDHLNSVPPTRDDGTILSRHDAPLPGVTPTAQTRRPRAWSFRVKPLKGSHHRFSFGMGRTAHAPLSYLNT